MANSIQVVRRLTTVPPPPSGQPAKAHQSGGSNGLLYAALGVAAAGGVWYYFNQEPEKANQLKEKAQSDEAKFREKAYGTLDAAKAKSDKWESQAKADLERVKVRPGPLYADSAFIIT